jgi:hypothetical protein
LTTRKQFIALMTGITAGQIDPLTHCELIITLP